MKKKYTLDDFTIRPTKWSARLALLRVRESTIEEKHTPKPIECKKAGAINKYVQSKKNR